MPTLLNLTGQYFGRLLAMSRAGRDKHRHAIWLCRCECGKETKVSRVNLIGGGTRSCGCLQKELCSERCGDKHHNWKGGITPENERVRASLRYKNWRKAVFIRDNFLCQDCLLPGEIQAHHIKSFAEFPELRFRISNGKTLCVPCHKKTPSYLTKAHA